MEALRSSVTSRTSALPSIRSSPSRSTPLVIRQAELGYPRTADVGVGVHDTGTLSDLPVKELSVIAKPHSWLYFVFGLERGFAFEWWLVVFGPLLGFAALELILLRRDKRRAAAAKRSAAAEQSAGG